MTTLRMTRPPLARPRPGAAPPGLVRAFALGLCVVFAGLTGCNSGDRPAAGGPIADHGQLPAPDADRIEYDAQKRTLTFYDLPDSSRWMVRVSGGTPRPAGPVHRLSEGDDPEDTLVFYTRPGGRTSTPVSVKQIQAAGKGHTSRID